MEVQSIRECLHRLAYYVVTDDCSVTGYSEDEWHKLVTVRRWQDLVLLNYTNFAQYHAEWTDLLRVCRGVVFTNTGQLVSLPFVKFFNLGEDLETDASSVARWSFLSVTEKVNGVLVQVFLHGSRIVYASRHGFWTPAARLAYEMAGAEIHQLIKYIPFDRWTILLELVHESVWQPGMVHPGDRKELVPLAVRSLNSFRLMPAVQVFPFPVGEEPPPFRLARQYEFDGLPEALYYLQTVTTPDWEGIVIQGAGDSGNQLVKLKSPVYVRRLALLRGLSAKRLLSAYESGGWSQVTTLLSGVEEIILQTPLGSLLESIRDAELWVMKQVESYISVPKEQIQQVPVEWRWVISYRDNEAKFNHAVRKVVRRRVEAELDDRSDQAES